VILCKIKQLRLARGWTLDDLVAKMGGIVTKQAISKYELGKSYPSPQVLMRMADAFNVKAAYLIAEPEYKIEVIAYRKKTTLGEKEQKRIENTIKEGLCQRVRIQNLVCFDVALDVPVQKFKIKEIDDVEAAANHLRAMWHLGQEQIANLTTVLENKPVHILEIDVGDKFDGIAAVALKGKSVKGVTIAVRKETAGERRRLNLAHELGHLVLDVPEDINQEKAAFRFGAAFLAPKECILREVGAKRLTISLNEMFILKNKFGMSVQALLYRLKDLGVISDSYCTRWFRYISRVGWKRQEPNILPVEKGNWLKQNVYKAVAENLMGDKEAETILKENIDIKTPLSLEKARSFMKLSLEERRKLLGGQAERGLDLYNNDRQRDLWQSGDFFE